MFLLYINDIAECLKFAHVNLFADDTLLHITTTDLEDGILKMNSDLENIFKWLNQNKLKINVTKSKWMIVCQNRVANVNSILLNNVEIERVKTIKYLGVIIDDHLKFQDHLNAIKKKISSKIYLLARIRKKINLNVAKMIYLSTIQVHFDYCSSVLFLCNKQQLHTLQKLQNRALRVILTCPKSTNCQKMLDCLNMLNVSQRIEMNVLCIIYKLKNNMLPSYLSENLTYVHDIYNTMTLRNASNFRLPSFKKTSSQNNLFYKGLHKFNCLPTTIKTCINLKNFKSKLTTHLKQNNE